MNLEENVIEAKPACVNCGVALDAKSKFCNICGAHQNSQGLQEAESKWPLLKQASLFYIILIVSCALPKYVEYFDTTFWAFFFEVALWISIVAFFAINWRENKKLLRWQSFSWQKLCAYLAITVTGAFGIHYVMGWLNIVIFPNNELFDKATGSGFLYSAIIVFFTAVTPAVFEELGFRGYLMQNLLKISDERQAIYVTAFLFAILHLQIVGLAWLLPLAVFLGYIRIKENTLWYGIFIHFAFNLTACIFQLF